MVIKIPVFEMLGKEHWYTNSSLKHSLGCSVPAAWLITQLAVSLTSCPSCAGTPFNVHVGHNPLAFLFSIALRIQCGYLNLKWCNSYCFKECVYLLTKTSIVMAAALMDELALPICPYRVNFSFYKRVCTWELHERLIKVAVKPYTLLLLRWWIY